MTMCMMVYSGHNPQRVSSLLDRLPLETFIQDLVCRDV